MSELKALPAEDDAFLDRCAELFRRLNQSCFAGRVRPAAFRRSRARCQAGYVDYRLWSIAVSLPYHRTYGESELVDTLKHEMIHLRLYQEYGKNMGHGRLFKEWAARIGAPLHARPLPRRPPRWIYQLQCPHCGLLYRRYRRWRSIACGVCCRAENRGRFAARFRLEIVSRRPYRGKANGTP